MKRNTTSQRRRHLIIAGLAGVVTPTTIFAGQRGAALIADLSATTGGGKGAFVVSGRILGTDAKPLFNASVEMWHAGRRGERALATTDGDGRFFATIAPAEHSSRPRRIHYRVSHEKHGTLVRQLYLAGERGISDDLVSHLQRDDTGIWRTTLGLTVA